jgi:CheY-like chemotaxis protein
VQSPLPQDESSRLEALRSLRILDTRPEQAFDDIVHLAALICDTPIAKIGFVDQQRVWLKAKIGFWFDEIPRERSFSTHAILKPDILSVPDPIEDATFRDNLLVTEIGVRFFAGVPLITSSHEAIGAVSVMDRVPHLLTTEQVDSLRILARRIMDELEKRSMRETSARHQGIHLAAQPLPPATILLVEDNEIMRNLLQRTLESVGLTVLSAPDGAEALAMSQQHVGTIDLVVSDIVMPRLNGIEFSSRIRAARPETKFLFITGFGDQFPELNELVKSGASVLEKPFLPSELLRRLEEALDKGKSATGTEG